MVVRDHAKCWICGHYGATSADHVIAHTEGGSDDSSNLKAAHAYPHGCLVCSNAAGKHIYCNEIKQGFSVERARRKIREYTGLAISTDILRDEDDFEW